MSDAPELLWDGDPGAVPTVLFAHGAGADCRHEWMTAVARGLAAHGLRVARFDFPYMAARARGERRPPDRTPQLLACLRAAAAATGAAPAQLVLAGKSMGGRMATMLADELQAAGVVAFGYPFHPPRKPEQLRTAHLETLRTPTLILHGERDPFGTRAEVEGYRLSPAIEVEFFADGDHSLAPRKKSGQTREGHLARAIERAATFARDAAAARRGGQGGASTLA
ncbi:MAG: alpha/beta fold hydrolase [Planctomycetota bacterium]